MNPAAVSQFKRTTPPRAYKGRTGRWYLRCSYIKGRSKQKHYKCSAVVYDTREDALRDSLRFRILVESMNVSSLTASAVNEQAPSETSVEPGRLFGLSGPEEQAFKKQRQSGGYTRRHEFVESSNLTLRRQHALARAHKAWRRQRVRYGRAEERFRCKANYANRRLAKLDKDIANLTSSIERIEERMGGGQAHSLLLKASPDDPDYVDLSNSQMMRLSQQGRASAMMLREMRERDLSEAAMTRNALTSAKAGDHKGLEDAILEARAERKRSSQATMSRRVAEKMDGVVSADKVVKYFREFEKHGGFARDGRSVKRSAP